MYNNLGLKTPRGSGTSGHVQLNKAAKQNRPAAGSHFYTAKPARTYVDRALQEHELRRRVEVLVQTWAEKQGVSDNDTAIAERRKAVEREIEDGIHEKTRQMERLRRVLRVKDDDDFDVRAAVIGEITERNGE